MSLVWFTQASMVYPGQTGYITLDLAARNGRDRTMDWEADVHKAFTDVLVMAGKV